MKKNSVFYKIFIPFFLLGTILVIGFSFFIYQRTYQSVEESFISDKKTVLRQIRSNIDRRVQTIEYAFSMYGSTGEFAEIFQGPLTANDFTTYMDIRRELSYIEMMVQGENRFDLISLDGSWGVINGSLNQLTPTEIEEYHSEYIDNDSNSSLYWQKRDDGIEMTLTLPIFSETKFALGRAILTNYTLMNAIQNDGHDQLAIYNNGQLLFTNSEDNLSELNEADVDNLALNQPTDFMSSGENYILLKSDYNNWLYRIDVNPSEIASTINNLRTWLIVVAVIFILFIGGFAYIFSQRFSRPIRKIQQSLNLADSTFKQSELNQVADSVTKIIGENQYLAANLSHQESQLETLFVLSLFRNRVDQREVLQRQGQFHYNFANKRFYVALIQIDEMENQHGGETDLLLMAINNIVTEMVEAKDRMLPIVLNDTMQATIFVMEENEIASRQVMAYCQQIQAAVMEYLNISISIGISQRYFSVLESKRAVDLAKEALFYRVNTGAQSIIFYKDISQASGETLRSKYPLALQEELFEKMRAGDESVPEIAGELIEALFKDNPNPVGLELMVMRLINEVVQLGQLLGASPEIFDQLKQIYMKSLSTYRVEELKKLLIEELIIPITESTQAQTDQEFKSLSEKIIQIVQTEYDKELSLDSLADRLHYNPNYLSSVFKKEYGENFGDYVQNFRLQIAKNWLKETSMTVKEIAERLQYRNPQNFIRFFKKKENLTPGEYRKQFD